MNDDNDNYKLYIPTNVKTRLEFFEGYGVQELISTIIVFACLFPVSFILYKVKGNLLLPIIIEFIGVAGTILATTKDENNLCVVRQIQFLIEFEKSQKTFMYRYFNKWRYENIFTIWRIIFVNCVFPL